MTRKKVVSEKKPVRVTRAGKKVSENGTIETVKVARLAKPKKNSAKDKSPVNKQEAQNGLLGEANGVDQKIIRAMASEASWKNGVNYFNTDKVRLLEASHYEVVAIVQGRTRYNVSLNIEEGNITNHNCDCPIGKKALFCKHCVAVALAWLNLFGRDTETEVKAKPASKKAKKLTAKKITMTDILKYVSSFSNKELLEIITEVLVYDDSLRKKIARRMTDKQLVANI